MLEIFLTYIDSGKIMKLFCALVFIGIASCADDNTVEPTNNAPLINSVAADLSTIHIEETSRVICFASDADTDSLVYKWEANGGTFIGTTAQSEVLWKAPESPGIFELTVQVNDGHDSVDSKIQLEVIPNFNWQPVKAGEFTFGKENELRNIEYDFEVMKFEVTNKQYIDFLISALSEGNIVVSSNSVRGSYIGDDNWPAAEYEFYDLDAPTHGYNIDKIKWNGSTFTISEEYKYHPVIFVTWFGANAFAEYYNCTLPSEEEWEKVARGNSGNLYPWGNSINSGDANFWNSNDPWERGTTPVGYYNGENGTIDRPSPFGAYDIIGNAWEWSRDFWDAGSKSHVLRGGGWNINGTNYYLRSYTRDLAFPNVSAHYIGFRCFKK